MCVGFMKLMRTKKRAKNQKWKTLIALGDCNAQVERDKTGLNSNVGKYGPEKNGFWGEKWANSLAQGNWSLVNSYVNWGAENRLTYKGRADVGASEIDEVIVEGKHRQCCLEMKRVDFGSAKPHSYDHWGVSTKVAVQQFHHLYKKTQDRKGRFINLVWNKRPPQSVVNRLNDAIDKLRATGGTLSDLQTLLENIRGDFLVKADKEEFLRSVAATSGVVDIEVRPMWKWAREAVIQQKINKISKEQARSQLQSVANNPMWKEHDKLPKGSDFFKLIPQIAEANKKKLEEEITIDEFNTIVDDLRRGAARDGRGLAIEIFDHIGIPQRKWIVALMNEVMEGREGVLGKHYDWRMRTSFNTSLFKKGDPTIASNYRFLSLCPILLKIQVTLLNRRFMRVLEEMQFFDPTTLGFREKLGTLEAILLYNLLVENCVQFHGDEYCVLWMHLMDIRKAFPSTDARYISDCFAAFGLSETKWFDFMNSAQRESEYTFNNMTNSSDNEVERFKLPNGLKEGCTSSPSWYLFLHEITNLRVKSLREKLGVVGAKIQSLGYLVRDRAERAARILRGSDSEVGTRSLFEVMRILFADDTSSVEQTHPSLAKPGAGYATEEVWREAGLEEVVVKEGVQEMTDGQGSDGLAKGPRGVAALRGALCETAAKENLGKFVTGLIGEDGRVVGSSSTPESRRERRALVGPNLGQQLQIDDEPKSKTSRMWKAFHSFKSRISGIGMSARAVTVSLIAICRSVLSYGQVSRCTPDSERSHYQSLEDLVLRMLCGTNRVLMRLQNINMSDMRFRYRLSTFSCQISYLKVRQLAHWLRSDSIAGEAIRGLVIPEKTTDKSLDGLKGDILDIANAGVSHKASKGRKTYVEEQYVHLEKNCCVPSYAISAIASSKTDNAKRIWYVLTREAFVRDCIKDYRNGNQVSEDDLEERKKEICRKYNIENLELNSHEELFKSEYCCLCQTAGHGNEAGRELHFHLYHDLGLRGAEYEERRQNEVGRSEEYDWEKRMREAAAKRKELIQQKEDDFLEINNDKICKVAEPTAGRSGSRLPIYHCFQCDVKYSTTVDAMDRHLVAHETENVTRVYKYTSNRVSAAGVRSNFSNYRPAEHTYWSKGKYRAGNFTKLCSVVVEKVVYQAGSKWKCGECGEEYELPVNCRGTDMDHFARKIEKHLKRKQLHGSCDTARKKVAHRRKNAERRRKGKGRGKAKAKVSGGTARGFRNRWNQMN